MNLGHMGCGVGGSKIYKSEYALYYKILCLKINLSESYIMFRMLYISGS